MNHHQRVDITCTCVTEGIPIGLFANPPKM